MAKKRKRYGTLPFSGNSKRNSYVGVVGEWKALAVRFTEKTGIPCTQQYARNLHNIAIRKLRKHLEEIGLYN